MSQMKTDSEPSIDDQFDEVIATDKYRKVGLWAIGVFFGGFLMWASLIPLEEGVPTQGSVVVDTKRKAIQHSVGGVIKAIFVKEGDFVQKGDLLLKLGDSKIKSEILIQENQINSLKETIKSKYTSLKKIGDLLSARKLQITLVTEETEGMRELVKDGYAPKFKQLALEKELVTLNAERTDLINTEKQTRQSINELKFQLEGAKEGFKILERSLDKKSIKATVSGQVVGLQKQAIGEVIQPAEKIMDLVPRNETLLVEAQIMPNLIDRVDLNDSIDIRFTSFSLTPFLVVEGMIVSISSDILTNGKSGQPYYLARVKITDDGVQKLGNRKLRPGMEVGVIIKTGKRTLLTYLLHPLTRRVAASLKEE